MSDSSFMIALSCATSLACAGVAVAVDVPDPTFTYCELEDRYGLSNDTFAMIETIAAPPEFADCFYITGKLQEDCIWDREPKCCLVAYDKPITAYDSTGRAIGLVEEVVATTDPFTLEPFVIPVLDDGTVRLGVTAIFDCFDGTMNGLYSNGLHGEIGEVCVTITFMDEIERSGVSSYTFRFEEGREALRLAYTSPGPQYQFAEVVCDEACGVKGVCYDVDYYWVQGLTERELYCLTVVGGKDYECDATDTTLGWFDKNGNQQGGEFGVNDDGPNNVGVYSELCVIADDFGSIRFAISGYPDHNFNGLSDSDETAYFEFLEEEGYIEDTNNFVKGEGWVPGASTKSNPQDVVRLSREDFDEYPEYACPPGHGVCGCYTIKVRLNPHEDEENGSSGGSTGTLQQRADMTGDGYVDSVDLAMLLSFWGAVQ